MRSCKTPFLLSIALFTGLIAMLLSSCGVVPRKYPAGKPFIYETNIRLEGNFTKEETAILESQLENQLDDSIRVRPVYKFFYKGFNRPVLERPPVYDSLNVYRSISFMRTLLRSRGYFRDSIRYDTSMVIRENTTPPQLRTIVNFYVKPGKQVKLDSISYVINNTGLQALADSTKSTALIKKGKPFSEQLISDELTRLVDLYRENGYMRFTFDELVGVWDTLYTELLKPTIDPFEQIRLMDSLRKKRENPTADLEIRLKPGYDLAATRKYYTGHTIIYPDYLQDSDTLLKNVAISNADYTIYNNHHLFKPSFVADNVFFHRGEFYDQRKFIKTINRFNQLGAWRFVNIEPRPRSGSDTVDFAVYLTPADKYSFTANIEGSHNSSFILNENLIGIGINAQLQNRNFAKSINLATTNVRYGTEVDTKGEFIKSRQISISHSITFPRPIPNKLILPQKFRDNFRTVLFISAGNIIRRDFFDLKSVNASWGYNTSWKNKSVYLTIPNIEHASIKKEDSLTNFLNENPELKTAFPENGLVLSIQGGFSVRSGNNRYSQIIRTNIEESGLLSDQFKLKILDSLFRFVKLDAEYIRNMNLGRNSLVFRVYAGAGFAMKTRNRKEDVNLPFFKQFYAGGPNSMRSWNLRYLGPGSTIKSRDSVPFRFGDFQFETNLEYRFPLFKLGGFPVSSCLFTDIGNVWFLKKNESFPDGNLTAARFFSDLAVGVGTGLRFDFQFFRIRLDYGIKAKDPSPDPAHAAAQNKWFYNVKPFNGVIQLGINFPFSF